MPSQVKKKSCKSKTFKKSQKTKTKKVSVIL